MQRESVYLTDDTNVALFPRSDGDFNCFDMIARAHYEVHGDPVPMAEKVQGQENPVRFAFHRPPSTPAASASCATPRASGTKNFVR